MIDRTLTYKIFILLYFLKFCKNCFIYFLKRNIISSYFMLHVILIYLFLVGVFEENARLLQWLGFFRQFNGIGPLVCPFVKLLHQLIFRLQDAGSSLALNHKFFNVFKSNPFVLFFGTMRLFSENF